MSLDAMLRGDRPESPQSRETDGLIASHFDRAYFIFNWFVDDTRTCLDLADCVFRGMDLDGGACERDFFRAIVRSVRELPARNEAVPGMGANSVLCWIFKDTVDLSYAEIASVMNCSREQVRDAIAAVRGVLLG